MDINEVTLLGRAGQDPEIKHLQNGTAVLNFSMATGKKWKDKSGQVQERTFWHRIVLFGNAVDWVKDHLRKGDQVLVRGAYESRQWEDKNGQQRTTYEVQASQVHTFNKRDTDYGQTQTDSGGPGFTGDDIPF